MTELRKTGSSCLWPLMDVPLLLILRAQHFFLFIFIVWRQKRRGSYCVAPTMMSRFNGARRVLLAASTALWFAASSSSSLFVSFLLNYSLALLPLPPYLHLPQTRLSFSIQIIFPVVKSKHGTRFPALSLPSNVSVNFNAFSIGRLFA